MATTPSLFAGSKSCFHHLAKSYSFTDCDSSQISHLCYSALGRHLLERQHQQQQHLSTGGIDTGATNMRPLAIVPFIFALVAFILSFLCIFAGNKPGFLEGYDILTVRCHAEPPSIQFTN
jgi:hypothetical protein